ncbi:unnamed protein product, partial [Symbiodinium microadriaticum]
GFRHHLQHDHGRCYADEDGEEREEPSNKILLRCNRGHGRDSLRTRVLAERLLAMPVVVRRLREDLMGLSSAGYRCGRGAHGLALLGEGFPRRADRRHQLLSAYYCRRLRQVPGVLPCGAERAALSLPSWKLRAHRCDAGAVWFHPAHGRRLLDMVPWP